MLPPPKATKNIVNLIYTKVTVYKNQQERSAVSKTMNTDNNSKRIV